MAATKLMAVGAVAAAGVAYYGYTHWGEPEEEEEDADDELPVVPPDDVVKIFSRLCEVMNAIVTQVMRQINAQGAQIPQAMLAQYLVEQFEARLSEAQATIFAEHGYSEEDVEAAVAQYERSGEAEVVEAVNQLRQLYMNVGGTVDIDLPEDLDVDKMCLIFEEYMAAVLAAQQAFTLHLQQLKARGQQVTSQQLTEFRQAKIAAHVSVVLDKHGLNNLIFQSAIEKYNDHPKFQAKIAQVKGETKSP